MVRILAVARVISLQQEFLYPAQVHIGLFGRFSRPHDAAVEKLLAVAQHSKNN
jgi:hypothetical protein